MAKKIFSYIIFANTVEAFLDSIEKIADTLKKDILLNHENYLSTRAIFYEADNKLVITPQKIDSSLMKYFCKTLGYENITNWYPSLVTNSLCESIKNDIKFFNNLVQIIISNPNIVITSYSYSIQFHHLIQEFKKLKLKFKIDNVPRKFSLVTYLDSKVGFRETVSHIELNKAENIIPKGIIVSSSKQALTTAQKYIDSKKGFVAKANFGESGWGIFISDTPSSKKNILELSKLLKSDSIWSSSKIVIEDKINSTQPINSPSSEVKVSNLGFEITYLCNQLINSKGEFKGITLGKNNIDPKLETKIRHLTFLIANEFHSLGYRGIFDIDFVIDKKKISYAVETNMRRTGGTHVYDLVTHLFKCTWKNQYIISNDAFSLTKSTKSVKDILTKLNSFLFTKEKSNNGIIITNYSKSQKKIGYIIISKQKKDLKKYLNEINKL